MGSPTERGPYPPPSNARRPTAFHTTKWFTKSLEALGPQAKSLVLAELRGFMKDWWEGWSIEELHDSWNYKPVSSDDACKQWKVRQIKFRKDYRVLFTLIEDEGSVWLLEAFGKTSTQLQDAAIERNCKRARTVWEDRDGRRR